MFIKEFTAGSLNIDCEWKWAEVVGEGKGKGQFIWDNLLESTSSSNSYKIKPNAKIYSPVIDSIYRLCWKEEWKAKFKNYCNTADDYECFDSMLPFIVVSFYENYSILNFCIYISNLPAFALSTNQKFP